MKSIRTTKAFEECCSEAVKIFGGTKNGYVKRAIKNYLKQKFEYVPEVIKGNTSGKIHNLQYDETRFTSEQIQGITIAFLEPEIKATKSRKIVPLQVDNKEMDMYLEYPQLIETGG